MLDKVFWNYFEKSGDIDAYLASKDFNNTTLKNGVSMDTNYNNVSNNNINNIQKEKDYLNKI